ncbi:DUF4097 family beta strand repeat-containing protein [Anaerosporobacter faecicola]|uniref:DUF4097 family beta strand repeat-containing protein n=1 Tax=Anaerosporobacter faecicola TaxID=2718714 RepID=UPI00143B3CF8|nr:DUF4097 family beta strand repeat-containing protein [Anaerosporobacter faecicola]
MMERQCKPLLEKKGGVDMENTYRGPNKALIIIVVIIGILILGSETGSGKKVDDSFQPSGDIHNIVVDNGDADIKIVEGDSFFVKGEDLPEDDYSFTQEGDTLKITVDSNESHFPFIHIGFFESSAKVTITIPSNTEFDTIKVVNGSGNLTTNSSLVMTKGDFEIGSGDVEIYSIKADTLYCNVGSGNIEVTELNALDIKGSVGSGDLALGYVECKTMSMDIGSGDMTCKSIEADDCMVEMGSGDMECDNIAIVNMDAELGSGNLELKGQLTGSSSLECGSGDIELDLAGNIDEYSFVLDGDDIRINGETYSEHYKSDVMTDKKLTLKAGSGEIEVSIR